MQLNNQTLSRPEEAAILHKVRIHIGLQKTDGEIDAAEGFEPGTSAKLRRIVVNNEVEAIANGSVVDIYAQYKLYAFAAIEQLNEVIVDQKGGTQPNAIVGAVKAKMDILKQTIQTGQDFGLVDKKQTASVLLVAGVDIRTASKEETMALIEGEMTAMNNLFNKAGKDIVDVTPSRADAQ